MKINTQKKILALYMNCGISDGNRKINIFEDFDETFLNFNINSKKKIIEYITHEIEHNIILTKKYKESINFKTEYFKN